MHFFTHSLKPFSYSDSHFYQASILTFCQDFIRTSVAVVESCEARVYGAVAQLLLDAEQLVVLGDALGSGRSAGLDLAGVQSNRWEVTAVMPAL